MISPLPLPSWLQSNPAAPVQAFLSGAQVGTSQRGQDIAARGQELSADARAEALDEQRRQFNERQAEEARAREDAAKQAAIQFQGVQEYHQLVSEGVPESKALMQAGAKMFYRKPEALFSALNRQELAEIQSKHFTELNEFRTADMLRKIESASDRAATDEEKRALKKAADEASMTLKQSEAQRRKAELQLRNNQEARRIYEAAFKETGDHEKAMQRVRDFSGSIGLDVNISAPKPKPLPKAVKERIADTLYETPQGPAWWRGAGWELFQESDDGENTEVLEEETVQG